MCERRVRVAPTTARCAILTQSNETRKRVQAAELASVGGSLKVKRPTPQKKFEEAVRRAKEYIAAGDIFQVVLSQRAEFEPGVGPFEIYRALRHVNPSPYMYYLRMGDTHVLGSSPEMLVRVNGRKLDYRPIAGTGGAARTKQKTARIETELLADEKERAEHVMLVDLGRNDLGRVSEYGSVQVRDLMFVERYSHVMHLVSAIEGQAAPELDALDAFAACFPAGTLERRAQGARHGDHRGTGTGAPRRLRRGGAVRGLSPAIWIPVSRSAPCS